MKHPLHHLRPLRPHLVEAAESVFRNSAGGAEKKLKSQLNHLIAVCNEASCHEEIALYLRYQSAREAKLVRPELVEAIVGGIKTVFETSTPAITNSEQQVAAWRLYAVYLARAFTYYSNAGSTQPRARPSGAPRPNSRSS